MILLAFTLLLYLSGSIPFGLLITKLFKTEDIREVGSGNIGATNVLRTGNKWAAFLTLLFDFLKGFVPCFVLNLFFPFSPPFLTFLYLIPVLGHIYPLWLNFKGGKGVATGLGVIFAFSWPLGLGMVGIWLLMALIVRTSSLSGLIAFAIAPFINWYFNDLSSSGWLFVLALLIFYTHRDNIKRLLTGQETKIGADTLSRK